MFKETNSYSDIGIDIFYLDDLLFYLKDGVIIQLKENKKSLFSFDEKYVLERITADTIFIRTRQEIIGIEKEGGKYNILYSFIGVKKRQIKYIDNTVLIYREENDNDWSLNCIRLNDVSNLWVHNNDNSLKILVKENHLIKQLFTNKSIIICNSIESGQELWTVDVGEMGKYYNIDNQLVSGEVTELFTIGNVLIAKVKASVLIAFDLIDGKQKWLHHFGSSNIYQVAQYGDCIHVFADFYYHINGTTGEVVEKKPYQDLFKSANFRDYWLTAPAINDRYIAIASHYDNAILVINRETFTVHQRIELEGCQNGIPLGNAPRLYGNRLFQQDGDGTLHIFEEV